MTMKFELDVVRFNAQDVITASGCAQPDVLIEDGGDLDLGSGCDTEI